MKLSYKQFSKIVELIEDEIDRINVRKSKTIKDMGSLLQKGDSLSGDDFTADETRRANNEIQLLDEMKLGLQEEINKISFSFGVNNE